MRNSIAAPLNDKFASDGEYDARFIDGRNASASAGELKTALAAHRPVFVATTSHGMTGPLNDAGTAPHGQAALRAPAIKQGSARSPPRKSMPRSTGWAASSSARIEQTLRHDQGQRKIAAVSRGCRPISACWWTPASRWCGRRTCWGGQPGVAIWYAHACCSADSLSTTAFNRLVPAGSNVDRILQGITACGDMIAPFPQALLSADRPALGDAAVELEQYSAGITIAASELSWATSSRRSIGACARS